MEDSSPDVSKDTEVLNISQRESHNADSAQIPDIAPPLNIVLTLLTINAQNTGANIPSLVDAITILDDHSPYILFLTEAPLHTHNGALTHVLRNRGYSIHHHPANAPSPLDTLLEARIPAHLTHPGGGC